MEGTYQCQPHWFGNFPRYKILLNKIDNFGIINSIDILKHSLTIPSFPGALLFFMDMILS